MRLLSPTLALVACSLPILNAAESNDSDRLANDDETIIITATRDESDAWKTPATTISLDDEEITQRGRPLQMVDMLNRETGINLLRNGSVGGTSSLSIRGAKSDGTAYLVDGIPQGDPTAVGGQIAPNFINPAGLAAMEVVKGPQSGLYGSRAVGGAVNVRRISPTTEHHGVARIEGGSYTTVRVGGQATGPINETVGYAVGLSIDVSDGFSTITDNDKGDPKNFEEDGFERYGAFARVDITLAEAWSLDLAADIMQGETNFDSSFVGPDDPDSSFEHERYGLQAGLTGAISDEWSSTTRLAYDMTTRSDPKATVGSNEWQADTLYLSEQVRYQQDERWSVDGGLDYKHEWGETTPADAFTEALDADASLVGIWGQGLIHLDHAGTYNATEIQAVLRYDAHSEKGSAFTYRLAAAGFLLDDRIKVHASYGTGFRAPTLYELFAQDDWGMGPIGNKDLEAEESSGYEIGHTSKLTENVELTNTWFHTAYSKFIDFDFAVGYYNLDSDEAVHGLENELRWHGTTLPLDLRLAYTWQERAEGEALLSRLPENAVSIGGRWWPIETAWVDLNIDWVDDREEFSAWAPTEVLESYTLVNLAGGWTFRDGWTATARIDNLTDEDYELASGYSTAGFSAYLGLTATY